MSSHRHRDRDVRDGDWTCPDPKYVNNERVTVESSDFQVPHFCRTRLVATPCFAQSSRGGHAPSLPGSTIDDSQFTQCEMSIADRGGGGSTIDNSITEMLTVDPLNVDC